MHPLDWLRAHDPGLSALRRAGRAAIVMPGMFALGSKVIGNPTVATFAAFGSFAMLLLVEFGGPMRSRLQAQAALAVVGAVFVCVGTLASRSAWLAAVAMALVGFGVLFAGVVSSVLAGATTGAAPGVHPAGLAAGARPRRSRIGSPAGGLAAAAAFAAVALLWPAPARDPLRRAAVAACRELAQRLRSEVARVLEGEAGPSPAEHDEAIARADAAVAAVQRTFFATPYRPTGLSTSGADRRAARRRAGLAERDHRPDASGSQPQARSTALRARSSRGRQRCSSAARTCSRNPAGAPSRSTRRSCELHDALAGDGAEHDRRAAG